MVEYNIHFGVAGDDHVRSRVVVIDVCIKEPKVNAIDIADILVEVQDSVFNYATSQGVRFAYFDFSLKKKFYFSLLTEVGEKYDASIPLAMYRFSVMKRVEAESEYILAKNNLDRAHLEYLKQLCNENETYEKLNNARSTINNVQKTNPSLLEECYSHCEN